MRENSKQKRRKRRKAASGVVAQICCLHRFALSIKFERILFLVALAFANQICDIQSTPIQLRHNQQQQQQQLGSPTAEFTSPPPPPPPTPTPAAAPRQIFRHRPDPVVTLIEGNTILLRCEVDHQTGDTQWQKDGLLLYFANRTKGHNLSEDRCKIIGNPEKGEHSLVIINARLEDSGLYECQVQPTTDETDDSLITPTKVIVVPRKLEPQPQNNEQKASVAAANPISLTKLPRGATSSPASLSFLSSPSNGQQQHQPVISLKLNPYYFLILAGILMLVNIYLIYSLYKRHQKNLRANSKCPEGSLGSSSGSPLVSSGQSTGCISAATTTPKTTNATTTSQQQQLEQFQLHQQQLQIQLQQQLQQLRPQISANCDYDYDQQHHHHQHENQKPDTSLRV